jgi:hypothetical protein
MAAIVAETDGRTVGRGEAMARKVCLHRSLLEHGMILLYI